MTDYGQPRQDRGRSAEGGPGWRAGEIAPNKAKFGQDGKLGTGYNSTRAVYPHRCPNEPRHRTAAPVRTNHKPNHDQPRSGLSPQRGSSVNDSAQQSVIAAARIIIPSPSIQALSSAFDASRVCLPTERYGNPGRILRAWLKQSHTGTQALSHKPEQNHRTL
jgi:hypothetical protein